MVGPYRPLTPLGGLPSTPAQSQRPYGYTPEDLLHPQTAQAIASPQSYVSAYSPLPVGTPSANLPLKDVGANIGKTALMLQQTPGGVPQPGSLTVPPTGGPYQPPPVQPQMGALEGLLRGIAGQTLGFLPPDIRQHVENGLGLVSNLLDIPMEIIGNLPAVPVPQDIAPGFSTDRAGLFERLPLTEQKQQALTAIKGDPMNALFYMSQYLRYNEVEVAHGLGVSPLVSDYFLPVDNLGDQIMKTLGVFGLPGRITTRAYADSSNRNLEDTVMNVDPSTLNPELLRIRQMRERGEINQTEFVDLVAKNGFGFSNNIWDNMLWETITDPMNAVLLVGVGARLAASSAELARVGATVNLARKTLPEARLAEMDAFALGRITDRFTERGMTLGADDAQRMTRDFDRFEWLNNNGHQNFADEALAGMSVKNRAMVAMDPLLQASAKVSQAINSPFDLFGHITNPEFKNGQRIAAFSSRASTEGLVQAYGPSRFLSLQKLASKVTGNDNFLSDAIGRTAANAEVGVAKDSLSRMAMESGAVPTDMPDVAIRAMSDTYHSRLSLQVEGWVRRVMTQYLPTSRLGKEAIEETMAHQRQTAFHQLSRLFGPNANIDELRRFADSADEKTLALIEHLNFGGPVIKSFHEARTLARSSLGDAAVAARQKAATLVGKKSVPRAEAKAQRLETRANLFERATIIGPKELTYQRAKKVLRDIKNKDVTAAREAVDRYNNLYENFAAKGLSDDELLRDLETFIQELTVQGEKGRALVREIGRNELPRELRDWLDNERDFARRAGIPEGEGYSVGLAPEQSERWRAVYNKEGSLIGVNAWAETVPDVADTAKVSSLSVARDRLFRPIRGERQLEEARRDFRSRAVNDYGLSRSEANSLFGAIRRRASEANSMPRGLTNDELNDLIGHMGLNDETTQRLGTRGVARLVAQAFEGDTMTVGITQKISGRMKTATSNRGRNWIGVVAERLYPMARFTYNPIFLLQEAAEPFFWNLIKGIRPGLRWTKEDLRSFESMRRAGFLGEWADQWEYSPSALLLFGQKEALRVAGPGTMIGKTWGKFLGEGRRVKSLAELKRLNFVRQSSREFGRAMKDYWDNTDPAFWDTLVRETGTSDPTRIGNYYWLNKAMHSPDAPDVQPFLMDASLPHNMGQMAKQQPFQLARLHNFIDFPSMRKAVHEGGYTESQFRAAMQTLNADPVYIDNAWNMTQHMGPTKWWEHYRDAFAEARGNTLKAKQQARTLMTVQRKIVQTRARILDISEEELLSRQMSRPTTYLDSTSKLPKGSRYQMTDADHISQFYGRELLPETHETVRAISREARAVAGTLSEQQMEMLRLIETAGGPLVSPPSGTTVRLTGAAIDGTANGDGRSLMHIAGPGLDYQSMQEMVEGVLGPDTAEKVLLGNRRIPSMFHTMTEMLPDDVVWRMVSDHLDVGTIHENRLRVEALRARSTLEIQSDLLSTGRDANDALDYIHTALEPGSGTNYFGSNSRALASAGASKKGPPNSGVHKVIEEPGNDIWTRTGTQGQYVEGPKKITHLFGWYNEKGELVSTVSIANDKQLLERAVRQPTVPGAPIPQIAAREQVLEDIPALPTVRADASELPLVNQPHVAMVGTKMTEHGKGYYGKLADFVDSEGTFKWDDVTGRGSYDLPGSAAAQSWLRKKDHASLAAAREALASRMLAGFSHVAHGRDFSPDEAMATIQSVVEAMSGKHPRAVDPAHLSIEQLLDFARLGGDEMVPNWRQRATLESMLPQQLRQVDTINPSLEGARAHGFIDDQAAQDITRSKRHGMAVDGNEYEVAVDQVTGSMFSKMQQDYREWAAKANADAWLNRTDWTAADVQALNVARYRDVMHHNHYATDADSMLGNQAVAINFELEPHPASDLYAAFPNAEHTKIWQGAAGLEKYHSGLAQVQGDAARWWASNLGEISGASIAHVSVGPGRHRIFDVKASTEITSRAEAERMALSEVLPADVAEMKASGEWDQFIEEFRLDDTGTEIGNEWTGLGPQASIVVTGSDQSIEAAVMATGSTFQRREVWATSIQHRPASGGTGLPGWDEQWVTDFVVEPNMDENTMARMVDSELWADQDLVRMAIALPDGRRAIRVIHEVGLISERGVDAIVPMSDPTVQRLIEMGATPQRGIVRTFSHKIDDADLAKREDSLSQMFDDMGGFVDGQGRKIDRANVPDWEWDSRLRWHVGKLADPWLQAADARGYNNVVTAVRNRYRGEALAQVNTSYWKHNPEHLEEWRARDQTLPPPLRGWHYQLAPGQGVRGATFVNNTADSTMYMLKHANVTTPAHELMHAFVPHFEDSMNEAIISAYASATGLRRRTTTRGSRVVLNGRQEEWLADEFVKYVSTGNVRNPALQSAFNMMGKLVKEDLKLRDLPTAHPEVKSLFDQLLGQANSSLSAVPFNPDEYRHLAAARYFMAAAEDAAHTTHYFRRGRNFLERSVNHPYLGYYPASYMWGKVVPELVKFLVREPFGVKAPMWGWVMASHVAQAMALQLNTDPEFHKWAEDHPQLIRFIQMMLPGTPWDIPVNLPSWMRHTAAEEAKNVVREANGQPVKHADILNELKDSADYAFGVGRFLGTASDISGELFPGPAAAKKAPPPGLAQQYASAYGGLDQAQADINDATTILAGGTPGQVAPGNIDLNNRPVVHNSDGTISTVRSITIEADGKFYLIPTVIGDKVVSNDEAIAYFKKTGQHLGVFSSEADADAYAQQLHQSQATQYAGR